MKGIFTPIYNISLVPPLCVFIDTIHTRNVSAPIPSSSRTNFTLTIRPFLIWMSKKVALALINGALIGRWLISGYTGKPGSLCINNYLVLSFSKSLVWKIRLCVCIAWCYHRVCKMTSSAPTLSAAYEIKFRSVRWRVSAIEFILYPCYTLCP